MPVSAAWHDAAKTIVRLDFGAPWTLAELGEAVRESRGMISSAARTVDVIWDATHAGGIPSNVITHFLLNLEIVQVPANQGAVIVVANSMFLQNFARLAKRSLPKITRNMHITDTLAAADALLDSLREARTG